MLEQQKDDEFKQRLTKLMLHKTDNSLKLSKGYQQIIKDANFSDSDSDDKIEFTTDQKKSIDKYLKEK